MVIHAPVDPWVKSEWKHEDVRRFVAAGEDMWHHGRMEPSSTSVAETAASACAASVAGGLEAVGAAGGAVVASRARPGPVAARSGLWVEKRLPTRAHTRALNSQHAFL